MMEDLKDDMHSCELTVSKFHSESISRIMH